MLKAAKLLGKLLLGILACAVLAYLVLVAINWRDRPPSAATLKLHSIIDARPAVANAENAFVFALGFVAPADRDPIDLGSQRLAWLEKTVPYDGARKGDPLRDPIEWRDRVAPAVKEVATVCREAEQKACAERFEALAREWRMTDADAVIMQRYARLTSFDEWREPAPVDLRAPGRAFVSMLDGQRLWMFRLHQLAEAGDVDGVRNVLSTDIVFWRNVQRDADNMISKMNAVAALRNHFFFGNLVLRRLPPAQQLAAIPASWQLEFSVQERSMFRAMAGELMFTESAIRDYKDGNRSIYSPDDTSEKRALGDQLLLELGRPLFQFQDETNYFAQHYLAIAEAFVVPLSGYEAAEKKLWAIPETGWQLYNLTGYLVRINAVSGSLTDYPYRVGSLEGMRRAALLTTQLRSRVLPVEQLPAELLSAPLLDPYSNEPFQWNAEEKSVTFVAPGINRWTTQQYFY